MFNLTCGIKGEIDRGAIRLLGVGGDSARNASFSVGEMSPEESIEEGRTHPGHLERKGTESISVGDDHHRTCSFLWPSCQDGRSRRPPEAAGINLSSSIWRIGTASTEAFRGGSMARENSETKPHHASATRLSDVAVRRPAIDGIQEPLSLFSNVRIHNVRSVRSTPCSTAQGHHDLVS